MDGQFLGSPTRFINHSCDPNLRQFTVSSSRSHPRVYELAFSALKDLEPGTEFTLDCLDLDDDSDEEDERRDGATECLCGAENCRGYLW